jgi:hypothetical protein
MVAKDDEKIGEELRRLRALCYVKVVTGSE